MHQGHHPKKLVSIVVAVMLAALTLPAVAAADTYEVQTTSDSKHPLASCEPHVVVPEVCSLRDAIERADAQLFSSSVITFGVSGTIAIGSEELPEIAWQTEIDGTTAPTYDESPVVLLDGSATTVPAETVGLRLGQNAGESRIEGLAIGGFTNGIRVVSGSGEGGEGSHVCGNYLGVEPDGETALPNAASGVFIRLFAERVNIGAGCTRGNLISGNGRVGVIEEGQDTRISANRIGVDAFGNALPNGNPVESGAGIVVQPLSRSPFIGGVEDGDAGNVIADNLHHGILVSNRESNALIHGNSIFDNEGAGIDFLSEPPAAEVTIESVEAVDGGTELEYLLEGAPNEHFYVDFYLNGSCDPGGRGEGEDFIEQVEVEVNESGFAHLTSVLDADPAEGEAFTATATDEGTLTTSQFSKCGYYDTVEPTVQIDFGPGSVSPESNAFFGFTASDGTGSGIAVVECELDGDSFVPCESNTNQLYAGLGDGDHEFRVRAKDKSGLVGPSEKYEWTVEMPGDRTYQVNSLIDTENFNAALGCTTPSHLEGNCSLRDAIALANDDDLPSTIGFAEAAGTIAVDEADLPSITAPVTIDATNAPGYEPDEKPVVEIDGAGVDPGPFSSEGLSFLGGAEGSRVEGLAIGDFDIGIRLTGSPGEEGSQLCGNWVGVGLDGLALPNEVGVESEGGEHNRIGWECNGRRNLISGNSSYGIVDNADTTLIAGSYIGLDAEGNELPNGPPLPGGGAGILIGSLASQPYIGPDGEGGDGPNTIATNHGAGVLIETQSSQVTIDANSIYANTGRGIEISAGVNTVPRPELESAIEEGGETVVSGSLEGEADEGYVVQYFVNQECDASGAGEGQVLFDEALVVTDGTGRAEFELTGTEAPEAIGDVITATARDEATEATSEFSNCVTRELPPPPNPEPPALTEFVPASPANDNTPLLRGIAEPNMTIFLWHNGNCTAPTFEEFEASELEAGIPVTVADDTTTEFTAVAFDGELSSACSAPLSYVEDSTPPTVEILTHPANPTNQTSATFTFSGADPDGSGIKGFQCEIGHGGWGDCETPKEYSGLGAGTHEFRVRSEDNAGNFSAPLAFEWEVELQNPTVTIESVVPAVIGAGGSSEVSFSSSKSGSYDARVGGSDCASGTAIGSGTYSGGAASVEVPAAALAEGANTVRVCLTDAATNTGFAAATVTLDATPPTVEILTHPANPTNQTSATFTFAGNGTGSAVKAYECSLDDAPATSCTSPETYAELGSGPHTFSVVAEDEAGNVSTPAEFAWSVDSGAPSVTIESVTPPTIGAAGSATLSFNSDKNGSYQLRVGGTDCSTGTAIASGSYSTSPAPTQVEVHAADLAEGANTLRVCVTDAVENTGAAEATLSLDSVPPQTQIAPPLPEDPTTSTDAQFHFSGSDAGSGVKGFECELDGGSFAACTSPQDYVTLAAGAHAFQVRAVDAVGNVDPSPASFSWTISTPKPTVVPVNGETFAVAPKSGKVLIKLPGENEFRELEGLESIPNGALIDATKGKVTLVSIDAKGNEQTAVFFGGLFRVTQQKGSGLTILHLAGGPARECGGVTRGHGVPGKRGVSPCGCPDAKASATASSASIPSATASARSGRGRHLWGSGHGKFRTEGNYGSATVRGTIWFVEDNCSGTFFKVKRGVVSVRDFPRGKTISLAAGKTYLAKP